MATSKSIESKQTPKLIKQFYNRRQGKKNVKIYLTF